MAAPRKMQKNIQLLLAERDALRVQLREFTATMTGRIEGIERAISVLQQYDNDETGNVADGDAKQGRGEAKALLLDLLREVGASGLNATMAEDIAKRRGKVLKRGTAASNLSRLKQDGIVLYDRDRYHLKEFGEVAEITPIPLRSHF
jgi:hypothetical protein